jgi:hypothetical protein
MKIKIVKLIALIIVGICASLSAHCQTNSNGLAVIGTDAFLVADKNATNISLLVTVLNTTNHDIVVLTKGLNCGFTRDETNKWVCPIALDDSLVITYQGHKAVPSFYTFAPVTLRPNEVAGIQQDIDLNGLPFSPTNAQITVRYSISADWGSRFGTWSGSVTSQPFKVSAP